MKIENINPQMQPGTGNASHMGMINELVSVCVQASLLVFIPYLLLDITYRKLIL